MALNDAKHLIPLSCPSILSASRSFNLCRCTLGSHLANLRSNLSLRCTCCCLCLVGLLLTFCCRLLLFAFFDGSLTCCSTSFWALGSSLFDYVERCTNYTTLLLNSAASSFLSDFLYKRGDISRFTSQSAIYGKL